MFGMDLGVAITEATKVWLLDTIARRHGGPLSAQELSVKLGRGAFRRLTWRVAPGARIRSSRASSAWITSKAARFRAGTITSPSYSAATRSSLLNVCGVFSLDATAG